MADIHSRFRLGLWATALAVGTTLGLGGCIEDPDCGVCDPDNLVLESITALNYASKQINLLSPECVGDNCPKEFTEGEYFVDPIGPCAETEEAINSPRGADEYCKLAPIVTAFGIEFIFNNLLEATSVELVRKRPDNPQLFEVYDWKTQVLEIQGPITRYNGDYFPGTGDDPDVITRLVNLACIDNLRDRGQDFGFMDYDDPASNPCNAIDANTGSPLKLRREGTIRSTRGSWDERAIARAGGESCDTPQDGVDNCCSFCDFTLSTQVAKYGLSSPVAETETPTRDQLLSPNNGTAITCNPETDDKYQVCRNFVPWVGRSDENRRYDMYWTCDPTTDPGCPRDTFRVPYYDKLRETHPDARPDWLERRNANCTSTAQCRSAEIHNLPGTECVGEDPTGAACDPTVNADCTNGRCVADWFVECRAFEDTTGTQGFCTDQRFSDDAAGACLLSNSSFQVCDPDSGACQTAPANTPIAFCDGDENGLLTAGECCQDSLGGSGLCDPVMQDLRPVARYQRNQNLPLQTRSCLCENNPPDECETIVELNCLDDAGNLIPEYEGEYAVRFVTKRGGVIYDPAIKGFEWRPANAGAVPRAAVELCAESRGVIDGRNVEDGWRANDVFDQEAETTEDFDRAMCSGQTYQVVFATPTEGESIEYLEDKVGNTMEGKDTYVFETPQFHVVPDSGFPTDNLRIGACDDFTISFSNQYDLSPENLGKLQIWRITETGGELANPSGCDMPVPVAGGLSCAPSKAVRDAANNPRCLPPCLTVNVASQGIGTVGVQIDPTEFGAILQPGETYRLVVPGLNAQSEASDPALYQQAFWDACGMPLIVGEANTADFLYDFSIDEPKCKEDEDQDGFPLSCDNAKDNFNPDQEDIDSDGFGDVIDLCATVAGDNNTADSDNDGIGNECDTCRRTTNQYNDDATMAGLDPYMFVRNIPFQEDTDGDGIGDVCDNCVVVANCEDYGIANGNEWQLGDPIEFEDSNLCQRDDTGGGMMLVANNMVGNDCEGQMLPNAAGVVGFGPGDDFDQDGISNMVDKCPRQPLVAPVSCTDAAMCGTGETCDDGLCNHLDTDDDDVGDVCDTCPFDTNPMQIADGGMQMDDPDGDFVGNDCETNPACQSRKDARPYSFFDVSVNGLCCITQLVEADMGNVEIIRRSAAGVISTVPLLDPEDIPIRVGCTDADEEARICRALPNAVANAPGILVPPPGCDEALTAAGYASAQENRKLNPEEFGGDLNALWDTACFLPQFDQDFDGLGDPCDLCPFDFDPMNLPFIDQNGRVWPNDGKFCNGEFSIDLKCDEMEPTGGEATGGSTGGMGTGGMGTGGSGG